MTKVTLRQGIGVTDRPVDEQIEVGCVMNCGVTLVLRSNIAHVVRLPVSEVTPNCQ